ncbi:MAG: OstA-like protein [Bacteroidota bacterium]
MKFLGIKTIIVFTSLFHVLTLDIYSQKTRRISYEANIIEMNTQIAGGAYRLLGDVVFRHKGTIMYCDSAYYYRTENSLDAFSDVFINRGDTTRLYGDFLHYDGNREYAEVRDNVRLINKESELVTDYLDYDMANNLAYYKNGGTLTSEENILVSLEGYYHTDTDVAHFRDSVEITNPDYIILSDTLVYKLEPEIAFFHGPTQIIGDSNYIYCEDGWYDTKQDISQLNKNAYMQSKEYIIKGDSLYYDRNNGYGLATDYVEIIDTIQHVILAGKFGEYYESSEEALLTDSAMMVQVENGDSLFLHADTLRSDLDTTGQKIVKAFYQVKFFRPTLQGKCDSLTYVFRDSVIQMFNQPVLWSENRQLTADYIEIYTKDELVDKMVMEDNAFISMIDDSSTEKYNQIKGRTINGYFRENMVYKIDVLGNAEAVYYPKDDEEYIGLNRAVSSEITIFIEEKTIQKIKFLTDVSATLHPISQVSETEKFLDGFQWLDNLRPNNKYDIFVWP